MAATTPSLPRIDDAAYLRKLYDTIQRRVREDDAIEDGVRLWAAEQLQVAQPLLDQVLRGDEGLETFLSVYVQQEREKWEAQRNGIPPAETPYDGLRGEPLCTCDDGGCHPKGGSLPPRVTNATDTITGVREYARSHSGLPLVLVGRPDSTAGGALAAFSTRRGRAGRLLQAIDTRLDDTERPDADPAATIGLRGGDA